MRITIDLERYQDVVIAEQITTSANLNSRRTGKKSLTVESDNHGLAWLCSELDEVPVNFRVGAYNV